MDPISFGLALSLHLGFENNYNRFHPYAQYETQNNYTIGVTYNSEERVSIYATKKIEFSDNSFIELGWASGYPEFKKTFGSTLAPVIRLGYEVNDNLTIWAMPGGEADQNGNFKTGLIIGTQRRF